MGNDRFWACVGAGSGDDSRLALTQILVLRTQSPYLIVRVCLSSDACC